MGHIKKLKVTENTMEIAMLGVLLQDWINDKVFLPRRNHRLSWMNYYIEITVDGVYSSWKNNLWSQRVFER